MYASFFLTCSLSENNIKEDLKLKKFGISEKSINELILRGNDIYVNEPHVSGGYRY